MFTGIVEEAGRVAQVVETAHSIRLSVAAGTVALGTNIFWTRPELSPIKVDGRKLMRTAKLRVFAFVEVPA